MSDIGFDIPWPMAIVMIGAIYWPVTLCLAILVLAVAVPFRGILRIACIAIGLVLLADCAWALYLTRNS